jgi:hypothetical protein
LCVVAAGGKPLDEDPDARFEVVGCHAFPCPRAIAKA